MKALATKESSIGYRMGAVLVEIPRSNGQSSKDRALENKVCPSDRFALIFAIKEDVNDATESIEIGNFHDMNANGRDPRP